MSNPRTPTEVAKITAADKKNPKRHRDRAKPKVAKVGKPYKRMHDLEAAYWELYAKEFPWLAMSDRPQLRLLCELSAEKDEKPDFPFNKLNMIRQILNSFGGSPADRSKVYAPDEETEDDPAKEFLN